jgi:hypothetical protein
VGFDHATSLVFDRKPFGFVGVRWIRLRDRLATRPVKPALGITGGFRSSGGVRVERPYLALLLSAPVDRLQT